MQRYWDVTGFTLTSDTCSMGTLRPPSLFLDFLGGAGETLSTPRKKKKINPPTDHKIPQTGQWRLLKIYSEIPPTVLPALYTQAQVKHLRTLKINVFCRLYNYMVRGC